MDRWVGVARLGGIGDNLIAASVLRPLKRLGYKIDMITAEGNHVLYLNNPFIDKLSIKAPGDIPEGEAWHQWFLSRSKEYDVFAHLSHSCEARHALFPASTHFWLPVEYRRKICAGSYLETVHDIAAVPYEFGPLFFPTEEEHERAVATKAKMGERVVGWVISGSRIDKIYPETALAISRIIRELDMPVMLIGASTEKELQMAKTIEEVVQLQNGSKKNLHEAITQNYNDPGGEGYWGLRRSISQLLTCDIVVSPDTGVAWAAAFEPMPKVLMVSHASPENISKYWLKTITLHADQDRVVCSPCHRLHDSPATCTPNASNTGPACMSDISVECLLTAIKAALGDQVAMKMMQTTFATNAVITGDLHNGIKGNGHND
jgi:ADP-heptose:LPS heptosyltransferase